MPSERTGSPPPIGPGRRCPVRWESLPPDSRRPGPALLRSALSRFEIRRQSGSTAPQPKNAAAAFAVRNRAGNGRESAMPRIPARNPQAPGFACRRFSASPDWTGVRRIQSRRLIRPPPSSRLQRAAGSPGPDSGIEDSPARRRTARAGDPPETAGHGSRRRLRRRAVPSPPVTIREGSPKRR